MALERVAELVRRAAVDTGVIAALRNDPNRLRTPLNLTEEHLQALHSASAFPLPVTSATRVRSTASKPNASDLPPSTALLPPEGSGGSPSVTTGPASPQGPAPAPPKPPTPPSPAGPPSTPPSPKPPTPAPEPPSVPPGPAPGWRPPVPPACPPSDLLPCPPSQDLPSVMAAMGGCECSCCTAIAAIVASVSLAASTAITAITAMAANE